MLNMNKNSNGCAQKSATKITEAAVVKLNAEQPAPTNVMDKPGRSLVSLIGRVDFCMAMQQAQPNLNALWNVYGCYVHIVGRFINDNRLKTFSVSQ
ncbi:CG43191, partial [Drosophila busckii]